MFDFLKKPIKYKLDRSILRNNDITLLIVDERWNSLFESISKTSEITAAETKIKSLLKEEAHLREEEKEISENKKKYMDGIIALTTEAFYKNNEEAKKEMQHCERHIKAINKRMDEIQNQLKSFPHLMEEANLELLEETIKLVYFNSSAKKRRVVELEKLIIETRENLKSYIDEKERLSEDDDSTYAYFHDLLGAEALEKLDRDYFENNNRG